MARAQQDSVEAARQLVEIADEAYEVQKAINLANEQYVMAASLDPSNLKANWMAGITYLETVNRDRSTKYFLQIYKLSPEYRFDLQYYIGRGYQLSLDFKMALENYNAYKAKLLADQNYRGRDKVSLKNVDRRIFECENGLEFIVNPANYSIVNVGSAINSEWPDYGPVLNEDETILIFTSRRKSGNQNEDVDSDNFPFEDVFISTKENGNWTQAVNIGEVINTPFHDSNLGLSPDAATLFLFGEDENGGGDIYISDRQEDGTYDLPRPMLGSINSSYSENSISVSLDGNTAYFSSDRPGGYGGLDIYVSTKDNRGVWGRTKNLGPIINTEFDEDGPFIDHDSKALYFSSVGRKGMGGFDIFRSDLDEESGEWQEPVNLGYPINTPDNDIYFVATKDGKRGYYASVREDGMGFTDIYEVTVPPGQNSFADNVINPIKQVNDDTPSTDNPGDENPPDVREVVVPDAVDMADVTLRVRVLDADTRTPLDNVRISLRAKVGNGVVPVQAEGKGIYAFTINNDIDTDYSVSVEKTGYVFVSRDITLPAAAKEPQEIRRTLNLSPARSGVTKRLRNVYFKFNQAVFIDQSYRELNNLEKFLAENPTVNIEIGGHTDAVGGEQYNKQLSEKRAIAVVDYLKRKGIDARRLKAVGYGEKFPLASNDDEFEGRELNRRVELKILN